MSSLIFVACKPLRSCKVVKARCTRDCFWIMFLHHSGWNLWVCVLPTQPTERTRFVVSQMCASAGYLDSWCQPTCLSAWPFHWGCRSSPAASSRLPRWPCPPKIWERAGCRIPRRGHTTDGCLDYGWSSSEPRRSIVTNVALANLISVDNSYCMLCETDVTNLTLVEINIHLLYN